MMLNLGNDLKKNTPITLDDSRSRAILICGKRGSGKSYTMGVIAEELFLSSKKPLILLVDPMGIYWKTLLLNPATPDNPFKERTPMVVYAPGEPQKLYPQSVYERMRKLGVVFERVRLLSHELSPDMWCELFEVSINEPLGIALFRAVQLLKSKGQFFIGDIIDSINYDSLVQDKTKEALMNRLTMASSWGIFSEAPQIQAKFNKENMNVVDLSTLDPGRYGLRNLVVFLLCQGLFKDSIQMRKNEEGGIGERVWLLIDEAHQFIPQGKSSLSKEILIRWIKEGRQPGLSCVMATQQPSSLDSEVISQCDAIIAHKTTNKEDTLSINKLSQDYMGGELKSYIRNLHASGEAVLVDDLTEKLLMVKVRQRYTQHGGGEVN